MKLKISLINIFFIYFLIYGKCSADSLIRKPRSTSKEKADFISNNTIYIDLEIETEMKEFLKTTTKIYIDLDTRSRTSPSIEIFSTKNIESTATSHFETTTGNVTNTDKTVSRLIEKSTTVVNTFEKTTHRRETNITDTNKLSIDLSLKTTENDILTTRHTTSSSAFDKINDEDSSSSDLMITSDQSTRYSSSSLALVTDFIGTIESITDTTGPQKVESESTSQVFAINNGKNNHIIETKPVFTSSNTYTHEITITTPENTESSFLKLKTVAKTATENLLITQPVSQSKTTNLGSTITDSSVTSYSTSALLFKENISSTTHIWFVSTSTNVDTHLDQKTHQDSTPKIPETSLTSLEKDYVKSTQTNILSTILNINELETTNLKKLATASSYENFEDSTLTIDRSDSTSLLKKTSTPSKSLTSTASDDLKTDLFIQSESKYPNFNSSTLTPLQKDNTLHVVNNKYNEKECNKTIPQEANQNVHISINSNGAKSIFDHLLSKIRDNINDDRTSFDLIIKTPEN